MNPWFTQLIFHFFTTCFSNVLLEKGGMVLTILLPDWKYLKYCGHVRCATLSVSDSRDKGAAKNCVYVEISRFTPHILPSTPNEYTSSMCSSHVHIHTDIHTNTECLSSTLLNCGYSNVWCVSLVNYYINKCHCSSRFTVKSLWWEQEKGREREREDTWLLLEGGSKIFFLSFLICLYVSVLLSHTFLWTLQATNQSSSVSPQ